MDWKGLASESHYKTAVAVKEALQTGDVPDAQAGIEELIDALSRSERRALKSQLVRLMAHIIKWRTQPDLRSRSWLGTILNAREEIAEIQEETPSLSRAVLERMWDKCFQAAKREAEGDMRREVELASLSWEDVFEEDYALDENGNGVSSGDGH